MVRFLLLRALEGWSFDTTYATLTALPELARLLGFRTTIPAASTAAQLVPQISADYLERFLQLLAFELVAHRTAHLAGDATGLGLYRFERWMDLKSAHSTLRHRFLKLHALVVTRARWPFFVAARLTEANVNECPAFPALFGQIAPSLRVGNVTLDKGYLSREIAQRIADRGGRPVIALKDCNIANAMGHPAWHHMVREGRMEARRYRGRYRRRAVIEGTFGAFKFRFGATLRSRTPHAQMVETLCRVLVWDILAEVYDGR